MEGLSPDLLAEGLDAIGVLGLLAAGLVAGFVNTVAGGGSMVTLPALMWLGLPADVANGTNRIGVILQSLAAARTFDKARRLDRGALGWLMVPTLLGAGVGALVAIAIPADLLEPIVFGLLIVFAVLLGIRPSALSPPENSEPLDCRQHPSSLVMMFGAGLYAGFIQAGVGLMLIAVLGGVLRYDLVRANAIKVVLVLTMTAVSFVVFVASDLVAWVPGLIAAASNMLGGFLAARWSIRAGAAWLRWIVLVIVGIEIVGVIASR